MSLTLPWKDLINIMPYEIVSSNYYKPLLHEVIEYPITEYEIENLPSSYILHFISIIQLVCKRLLEGNFDNNMNSNIINEDREEVIKKLKEEIEYKNDELENNSKIILEYQKIISALQKNISKIKDSYRDKIDLYKTQLQDTQNREINNKLNNMKIYMTNLLQHNPPLQQKILYFPQPNYNINDNNRRESQLKSNNTNVKIIDNRKNNDDNNQRLRSARVQRNNQNIYDTINSLNMKINEDSNSRKTKLNQVSNQFAQFKDNITGQINTFKNNSNSSRILSKSLFNK